MALKRNGITSTTSKDVIFGNGVIYQNLEYSSSTGWGGDVMGATTGGSSMTYEREFVDLEIDGKFVKVQGFDIETGATGTMTLNLAEYNTSTLTTALGLVQDTTDTTTGYTAYKPGGVPIYVNNLGYVGYTADGRPVICIFEMATCLGAYETENTNKEQGSISLEFSAVAPSTNPDTVTLPIKFYYPDAATVSTGN